MVHLLLLLLAPSVTGLDLHKFERVSPKLTFLEWAEAPGAAAASLTRCATACVANETCVAVATDAAGSACALGSFSRRAMLEGKIQTAN